MKKITISSGRNLIIPVYGEHYAQKKRQTTLKELALFREKSFSLAPRDEYQKKAGWPNYPFANVCPEGKFSSSKENWLGYIAPPIEPDSEKLQERDKYIRKLIKLSEVVGVTVSGQILDERKEGGDIEIVLYCSRKSIDEEYEAIFSPRRQVGFLAKIRCCLSRTSRKIHQLPFWLRPLAWIGFWELVLLLIYTLLHILGFLLGFIRA